MELTNQQLKDKFTEHNVDVPKTQDPDPKWIKQLQQNMSWAKGYQGNSPKNNDREIELRDRLLDLSGHNVQIWPDDPDTELLLAHGQLWSGDADYNPMATSQCHRNVIQLWLQAKDNVHIVTGYALSEDGLWRCHSWAIEEQNNNFRLIETTTPRLAYYGYVMTNTQAKNFYYDN